MKQGITRRRLATGGLALAGLGTVGRIPAAETLPFLRGVNFNGLSDQPGSQAPARPAVDYYIRQKRMNVVRLNFPWEVIQPVLSGPLADASLREIDDQVDRVTAAGAYVVLELHNYGRRNADGRTHVIGETSVVTSQHFADVWTRIANRWKGNARVIFALMNEPHDQRTDVLVAVSNDAINAIRRTGATQLIMVSGNDWNSMGWAVGSQNQKLMLAIRDPADNFCFDVHHYFDDWSRGQTPNVRERPLAAMLAFTEWARANRRRGFCGEFGCHVNKRGLDACQALLQHIESNRDVFVGWAWWGAGGPWQPDYVFLLDPFASATSRTNPDPEGAKTWARPVDRPQMMVLQRFLPATATPFNGWLIEDGLAGRLMAAFRRGDFMPAKNWRAADAADRANTWIDSGPSSLHATPV
ncbi:MAG: macromolecule metabolism protein, partial [Variovorax sp.]|nr:macromolecule metabolism protein [Variovorax sp.]